MTSFLAFQYNADVNAVDPGGRTPLYYARLSGCKNCVEILLHSGCVSEINEIPSGAAKNGSLTATNRRSNPNGSSCDVFENLPASVI